MILSLLNADASNYVVRFSTTLDYTATFGFTDWSNFPAISFDLIPNLLTDTQITE